MEEREAWEDYGCSPAPTTREDDVLAHSGSSKMKSAIDRFGIGVSDSARRSSRSPFGVSYCCTAS